ncbi:STYKc [Seminavis robusta]|uniref:STYKc n=1 Tax=Seminavis robusta TaxID=568900 RepID=A0A9N8E7W9_9STRA|nr:STYKc [Seminavis robusta]|eukprot:Sro779_g201260.1 STYKc (573) ;mRNA; f:17921-19639
MGTTTAAHNDDSCQRRDPQQQQQQQSISSRRRPQHSSSSSTTNNLRSTYQRTNSFSKKGTKVAARGRKWRRRILGLILVGFAFVAVLIRNPNLRNTALAAIINRQPKRGISNFGVKPLVVGYGIDLVVGGGTDAPRKSNGMKTRQILFSKYHPVVRIHPSTFQIIPPSERFISIWAALRGSSSTINTTGIKWNWNHHSVDLMGLEIPDMVDWSTYQYPTRPDPDEETKKKDPCQLPHGWMNQSFPTCSNLHAFDMMSQLLEYDHRVQQRFLMGTGSMRSVWLLEQITEADIPVEQAVLKTLRMKHDFDAGDLDRHRRDALISERLTASPHILNIYGYCGNSAIYQYANSGTLYDAIGAKEYREEQMNNQHNDAHDKWEQWTSQRKLEVSYQVVSALADLHDIDHDGIASVAHDDLDITQYVSTDGGNTFQLSDFNGAPFVEWDSKEKQTCSFRALMKGGKTRSPEEYDENTYLVTEKIDIYALGNILYTIVEGQYPFYDVSTTQTMSLVAKGHTPPTSEPTSTSKDHNIQLLLNAMELCWVRDPRRRATARKIQNMLKPYVERNKKHPGLLQ